MPIYSDTSDREQKTLPATQFRREEFRKQGKVALSREVLSVALLLSGGVAIYLYSGELLRSFSSLCSSVFKFDVYGLFGKSEFIAIEKIALKAWANMVLPIFIIALIIGFVACSVQVGLYFTAEPLSIDFNRINPVNGFQKLFSSSRLIEIPKVLIKLIIGGVVLYLFLNSIFPTIHRFFGSSAVSSVLLQGKTVFEFLLWLICGFMVLAIFDYAFQKYQLESEMRMSPRELKEELKLREGDPLIKSRIKSIQRRIARRRMMEDVPKSNVVVTNPRHLAVALQYDHKTMIAPKVVAKGAGIVAEKIKEIARNSNVPIVENKPLARTLFKTLDIGDYIPRELYKAVAEVLAYVYRLKNMNAMAHAYA